MTLTCRFFLRGRDCPSSSLTSSLSASDLKREKDREREKMQNVMSHVPHVLSQTRNTRQKMHAVHILTRPTPTPLLLLHSGSASAHTTKPVNQRAFTSAGGHTAAYLRATPLTLTHRGNISVVVLIFHCLLNTLLSSRCCRWLRGRSVFQNVQLCL